MQVVVQVGGAGGGAGGQVVCRWCAGGVQVVQSVDMNARDAPNYGGRVPVDATP